MEEQEIRAALDLMERDPGLITKSVYRADSLTWLNNKMPFADAHLAYLKTHSALDPKQYLANLRLRLKSNPRI
jgi:hypothetical protein